MQSYGITIDTTIQELDKIKTYQITSGLEYLMQNNLSNSNKYRNKLQGYIDYIRSSNETMHRRVKMLETKISKLRRDQMLYTSRASKTLNNLIEGCNAESVTDTLDIAQDFLQNMASGDFSIYDGLVNTCETWDLNPDHFYPDHLD